MNRLLYLTSSSYSGSTLLTFLVNQHPEFFTIGELEGWSYGDEEYRCSCGDLIEDCAFFKYVETKYKEEGLPFSTRDFGTKLRLSNINRLNRYLTSGIPYADNSAIEKMRDALLWRLPGLKNYFAKALRSNRVFIESALRYKTASVFLDATKNPFRLRMLNKIEEFDLRVLYLVRDIRGVVASNVRKKNISVEMAAKQWLTDQDSILRILKEFPGYMSLYYEDLCAQPTSRLAQLYSYLDVHDYPFEGNIRESEHHILGNSMRVNDINEIRLDERSKTELSKEQLAKIDEIAERYLQSCDNEEVHRVVLHYLDRA